MKETFVASMDKWRTMGHSLIQTDFFITFVLIWIEIYQYKSGNEQKSLLTVYIFLIRFARFMGLHNSKFYLLQQHISNITYTYVTNFTKPYEFNLQQIRNSLKQHNVNLIFFSQKICPFVSWVNILSIQYNKHDFKVCSFLNVKL